MPSKIMSFGEFEKVYEANEYILEDEAGAAAPPKDDPATSVVSSDGSIEEQPGDILDLLKGLGKKEEGDKTEEDVPNESLDEQDSTNTLKAARIGEKSERVKDIQKLLGLKNDGDFGQATKNAVMQFQKEAKVKDPKVVVDGIVGNQTYGLMLKVKKGITDQSQITAMIDKFQSSGKTVVSVAKAGTNIALDPRLYEIFEKIEIITNNGTTYVVATPRSDAAAKVAELKKANLIGADFSWLLAVPAAVGKAIVYTVVGAVVIQIEIAKAMVNAAIAAGSYIGKGAMAVASNIAYGLGQIGKWVGEKGAQAWATLKQDAAAGLAVWAGFNEKAKNALKSSAKALVAWAAAVGASLTQEATKAYREATRVMAVALAGALGLAAKAAKSLGEFAKIGIKEAMGDAKALVAKVQSAYDEVVTRSKAIGNATVAGFQKAGATVTNVLKSGVSAAGDALISAGTWLKTISESLEANNGELVLEWLEY